MCDCKKTRLYVANSNANREYEKRMIYSHEKNTIKFVPQKYNISIESN